jgi:hypothetical protein
MSFRQKLLSPILWLPRIFPQPAEKGAFLRIFCEVGFPEPLDSTQ